MSKVLQVAALLGGNSDLNNRGYDGPEGLRYGSISVVAPTLAECRRYVVRHKSYS